MRAINRTDDGREWLTDHQLEDLRNQLLRHSIRKILEAIEAFLRSMLGFRLLSVRYWSLIMNWLHDRKGRFFHWVVGLCDRSRPETCRLTSDGATGRILGPEVDRQL